MSYRHTNIGIQDTTVYDQEEHGFLISGTHYPIDHGSMPVYFDLRLSDDEAMRLVDFILAGVATRRGII